MAKMGSYHEQPQLDDSELFKAAVGPVTAMINQRVNVRPAKPKPRLTKQPDYLRADIPKLTCAPPATTTAEETTKFNRQGVPVKLLKKLRTGELTCDAVLDLHGLSYAQAQLEIALFIGDCYEQHDYCVKIIHGKGQPHALLKNLVNTQLREYKFVDAFCSAPERQGGAGAVLILLAKSKHLLLKEE